MPYQWVEPETFMSAEETGDMPVFHCYRHGFASEVLNYHYQVESDEGYVDFDVRDAAHHLGLNAYKVGHKTVIHRMAQEGGIEAFLHQAGLWQEAQDA